VLHCCRCAANSQTKRFLLTPALQCCRCAACSQTAPPLLAACIAVLTLCAACSQTAQLPLPPMLLSPKLHHSHCCLCRTLMNVFTVLRRAWTLALARLVTCTDWSITAAQQYTACTRSGRHLVVHVDSSGSLPIGTTWVVLRMQPRCSDPLPPHLLVPLTQSRTARLLDHLCQVPFPAHP
jgi:hypothetical protein